MWFLQYFRKLAEYNRILYIQVVYQEQVSWQGRGVRVMVFNATFNNITVTCISWQSVLLVEETGVPSENHRPVTSH